MSSTSELFLLIFGSLGWLLSLYFGFFRFKHFQWTRHKVQYDLFTKINQKNDGLFLKASTLSSIKNKNKKIIAKRKAVLLKYLESLNEKVFLIKDRMVPTDIGLFWINVMVNELRVLREQDAEILSELSDILEESNAFNHQLRPIFGFAETEASINADQLQKLYTQLTTQK